MKKVVILFFVIMLVVNVPVFAAQPEIDGKFAVALDARTGDVLYDKNAHGRTFPASTTKVLTALVLLDHMKPGERITFSPKALEEEKSNYQIEFHPGESVDRDTALMILMVLSANDMAYAIAEHVTGSIEAFAKLMNEKAQRLGAKESHFVTPNGLHHPEHYTTPYDMALITKEANKYPELMQAMRTKRTTVTTSSQTVPIFNKAKFFRDGDCIGAKTGFTNEAGNTLVQVDKRGEAMVVGVVMASHNPSVYDDMDIIFNYAFPQFSKQLILDQKTWSQRTYYLDKPVSLQLEASYEMIMKQDGRTGVETVFHPKVMENDTLYQQGIRQGDVLGYVDVMKNGNKLATLSAVAMEKVTFQKPIKKNVNYDTRVMLAGIGVLVLMVVYGIKKRTRTNRNVQQYYFNE